jgi:hypothetical protein
MSQAEKIKIILENLPLLPGKAERIPLLTKEIQFFSRLALANERNSAKECTEEKAKKELFDFVMKCKALDDHIAKMHKTSLSVFENESTSPVYLREEIRNQIKIVATPKDLRFVKSQDKGGRPKARQAEELTKFLARIYEELTGKKAARIVKNESDEYGEFLDFTKEIFDALEIKRSAKSQVSVRSKRMYKKPVKKTR